MHPPSKVTLSLVAICGQNDETGIEIQKEIMLYYLKLVNSNQKRNIMKIRKNILMN